MEKKKEEIKRLKEEYVILQNASDEVEEEKDKEIERLNNITNELEKWCIDYRENTGLDNYEAGLFDALGDVLDKIKELKGSDKE